MLDRTNLRAYQERLIQHVIDNPNCALWVDMGLGKTISTLSAIAALIDSFDVRHTLIIAPLRVARKTWSDEIMEWAHVSHLTTNFIIGTPDERMAGIEHSNEYDITLINRENVDWLFRQFVVGTGKKQKLVRPWPWDTEVHTHEYGP